jgi:hypothetical protein
MKRILIAFLAIILLTGCSASHHIKRARKLDPSLFQARTEIERDTLIVEVPTVLERVKIDTLVEIVQIDPITNIETIIKYKIHNDTIMIDCPPSEIITETIIKVETITIKPTFWEKLQWFAYVLIGLIVFLGVKKVFM